MVSGAAANKAPIKHDLHSWPAATAPWTRIHVDFAGPLDGTYYLVVIDAHSKWPEVIPTRSIAGNGQTFKVEEDGYAGTDIEKVTE